MTRDVSWDDLESASRSPGLLSRLLKAFRGASHIYVESDRIIAEPRQRQCSSKCAEGEFTEEEIEEAERRTRPPKARNGRPITYRRD